MSPMIAVEWPLLVASGMVGAAHCLGMCGPFALAIGASSPGWKANLSRQVAYTLGRIFTYASLGACAGFVAARFAGSLPVWVNVPAALAIAAGLVLVWQGLLATGLVRRQGVGAGAGCPGAAALRGLLTARGLGEVFLAGLFTGLLPCGLLYGMLAYAASCRDVMSGMVAMAAFGVGTAPGMMAAGLGGSILGVAGRRRLQTVAAWCLVATGVVSIVRGASFVALPGTEPAGCPFCSDPAGPGAVRPGP